MPRVLKENISHALKKVREMDIKTKELVCDELFLQQPNILSSVIVQKQMGNNMNDVDSLLHILIVLHIAIKDAGMIITKISEQEQDRQLEILKQSILFSNGLSSNFIESSINQYIANQKEPVMFSYVLGAMQEAGFLKNKNEVSKYLIMTGINLVSCIANAETKGHIGIGFL